MIAVPTSLLGQTPAAILHTQGGVWVNGYEGKEAAAVFSGDIIETKPAFSAELKLEGTSVQIQPQSVLKFEGDALTLDHGSVNVGTAKGFKVLVRCLTVVPVTNDWTDYVVTYVDGTVQVAARKNDVNVNRASGQKIIPDNSDSQRASVREGEQHNYDSSELCGGALKPMGGANSLEWKWIALGAGGGAAALIWILVHGGGSKTPVSNSQP